MRDIKHPYTTAETHLMGGVKSVDKFNFKYGKIEVRAKFTNGQESWPTIWMMTEDETGEVWSQKL
ncbi:family 16 glycosylhydrolase [Bacteroides sedimenti]|uniref:GH16 domain-containing protein n=1 Tax=Bacteroides sedimenti TaxID=2136147 RepID=A0ABM8IG44_9BACE